MTIQPINPDSLSTPKGYNNGMLAQPGRLLFIAGQVGWDRNEVMAEGLVKQFDQALGNILDVVAAAGGVADSLCRFTIFIKNKQEYIALRKEIGVVYRKRMGKHFPAMSLVVVADLLEESALVEIEATAVIS